MEDELKCPECDYICEDWYDAISYNQTADFNDYETITCNRCETKYNARQRAILQFETEELK